MQPAPPCCSTGDNQHPCTQSGTLSHFHVSRATQGPGAATWGTRGGKSLPVTQSGGRVTKANQEETGRTGCHRSQAGGCGKVEVGAGQGGRKGVHPAHQRRSGNNQAGKPSQRQEERILKIQFLERHWELIKGKLIPSSHKYGIYLQVERCYCFSLNS